MDSKLSKKGVLPGRWSTPEFISLQYGEHSGDSIVYCYGSTEEAGAWQRRYQWNRKSFLEEEMMPGH